MKSTQGAGLIGDKTFYFRSIILLPVNVRSRADTSEANK